MAWLQREPSVTGLREGMEDGCVFGAVPVLLSLTILATCGAWDHITINMLSISIRNYAFNQLIVIYIQIQRESIIL